MTTAILKALEMHRIKRPGIQDKLSVVMPVFNEVNTIEEILERVLRVNVVREVIVVDDYSTDGTREILAKLNNPKVRVFFHERNMGKGSAVKTGFSHVKSDIVVVQDADLEYDPSEFPRLIRPILERKADVVYGSRFTTGASAKAYMQSHYVGNKGLTLLANILYNTVMTDMETCYKIFRYDIIQKIEIRSHRFSFDPEITAKVLKLGYHIHELPITYTARAVSEGKKISWKDGFSHIWTLFKYRFVN